MLFLTPKLNGDSVLSRKILAKVLGCTKLESVSKGEDVMMVEESFTEDIVIFPEDNTDAASVLLKVKREELAMLKLEAFKIKKDLSEETIKL